MGFSRCFSVTTTTIFASSLPNNNTNNTNNSSINNKPSSVPTNNQTIRRIKKNTKQLSVTDVERAIGGGGNFSGKDSRGNGEEPTFLEKIMTNPFGEEEFPVEKKLRETGEWIIDKTEGPSQQAAGQEILLVVCLWILPIWVFSLLVASGVVKLPFSVPFLDDLIM